jgi:protein tyrosine/serine phosphatase
MAFRNLPLPEGITGRLYLHSMPGRRPEKFSTFLQEASEKHLDTIRCLCDMESMQEQSPEYAQAVRAGTLPYDWEAFPITDYGVPENKEDFKEFVTKIAGELRVGKTLLLHCGAGIGRTGMVASCILQSLGLPVEQANSAVRQAGSGAETPEQRAFVQDFANL